MTAPTAEDAGNYSGVQALSADPADVSAAFTAEKASQANRCQVPIDTDPWPDDLVEALFRRTAHNLALRQLPLGVNATLTDGAAVTDQVGGLDAEVVRLEAPYRIKTGRMG